MIPEIENLVEDTARKLYDECPIGDYDTKKYRSIARSLLSQSNLYVKVTEVCDYCKTTLHDNIVFCDESCIKGESTDCFVNVKEYLESRDKK